MSKPTLLPPNEEDFTEKYHRLLLSEVQKGNVDILLEMSTLYKCHWSTIRAPKTGDTVCHIAARMGHLTIIETILSLWEQCSNITNSSGKTPLHEAAQYSKHEIVQHLLKHGGGDSGCIKQGDWTPLMLACTKTGEDAYRTVKHLLNSKDRGGLRRKNKDGWTALHMCIRTGDEPIFDLLMQHHEDSDVSELKTKNGRSLLHVASLHGNLGIAAALLKMGANVNATDSCGNTALHDGVVAERRAVHVVRMLLDSGANLFATNGVGLSVLHSAAAGHSNCDVVEYVLRRGFDADAKCCAAPAVHGLTPLHVAARSKRTDNMRLLRTYGAIDVPDQFGRLPDFYLNLSFD